MSLTYLIIPLFFIALILYVAWPLMGEAETPVDSTSTRQRAKRR